MNHDQPNALVHVDPTNPGQFFARCGWFDVAVVG
jgi:hypothetical protein